jgi:N6-adenosine-specific RNA methylase IME4
MGRSDGRIDDSILSPRADSPTGPMGGCITAPTGISGYFTGLPLNYFGAGIVDPGWRFATYSAKGRGKCADRHYHCDPLTVIKTMPVGELFTLNATIAVWVPQFAAHWAIEVIDAWGFTFKTMGAWAKQSSTGRKWAFGQGKILRCAAEFYLLATRGNPPVRSRSVRNLIIAPTRAHSVKPDQLHDDMMALYAGPYLELFARRNHPGWTCWGDQLAAGDGDDDGTARRGQGRDAAGESAAARSTSAERSRATPVCRAA